MGNSAPEAQEREIAMPEGPYQLNRQYEDHRYGAVFVYSNTQVNRMLAKCAKLDNTEEEHLKKRSEAESVQHLKHENLIEIKKVTAGKRSEACSTFYFTNIYSQFLFYGLDKEIDKRRQYKESFTEEEIWYTGNSVLSAVDYLAEKGVFHEDVRPTNVLLDEDGSIRLFWNNAFRPGFTQFVKLMSNENDNECYLSPNLYAGLKGKGNPQNDPVKSDVFSTGMVLLEMASNSEVIDAYDQNNYSVKKADIDHKLQNCSGNYSPALVQWIREMLEMNESLRQDPEYFLSKAPSNISRSRIILQFDEKTPKVSKTETHASAMKQQVVEPQHEIPKNASIQHIQPNLVQSRIENPQIVNSVSRIKKNRKDSDNIDQIYIQPSPFQQIQNRYEPNIPKNYEPVEPPKYYLPPPSARTQPDSKLDFLYLNKDYNAPVSLNQNQNIHNQQDLRSQVQQKTEGSFFENGAGRIRFKDYYIGAPIQSPPVVPRHHVPAHSHSQIPYVVKPVAVPIVIKQEQSIPFQHAYQAPFNQVAPNFEKRSYEKRNFDPRIYESPVIARSERKDFAVVQNEFVRPEIDRSQQLTSIEKKRLGPILEREKILQDIDRVNVDQIIQEVKREQQMRFLANKY